MAAILRCQICKQEKGMRDAIPAESIRGPLLEFIKAIYPDFDQSGCICLSDLNRIRGEYIQYVMEGEIDEVKLLQSDAEKSVPTTELLSKNFNDEFDKRITPGERMADRLADFGGSWKFIGIFMAVMFFWIVLNAVVLVARPFDPYPFVFLNLILSCLAAIQAPVIMMSQNRQETKDRYRAEYDFKTNVRAEIEIRSMHDKLDYLLMHQWQKLLEIQRIQLDLMEQLAGGENEPDEKKEGLGEKKD